MADNTPRSLNLNLTPEERRTYYQLFQAADKTNLGVITGEVAVPFFEKTMLSSETLGLIWQIADKENRGLLTPSGFSMVMRLIGHAQAGRDPTDDLALQPGPLPKFDGRPLEVPGSPRGSGAASPPPGTPIRVPPLNADDISKFTSLFEKSDVHGGLISGEVAKQIFERARLSNETLGRIWNLADTKQRGALDMTEFIIAMHLLTSFKSGAMRGIPQVLPPGLYEAAARKGVSRSSTGSRPGVDIPPVPAIPREFTGPQRTQSPINRQSLGSSVAAQFSGNSWLITPQEKSHFDSIFATIDTAKSGTISGDQAVSFFMNAQLPEETLAQIWDLADIDADGQLVKDEFAVAMYLVRQQRAGKEPLPQVLPPALVPPSMRHQAPVEAAPVSNTHIPASVSAAPQVNVHRSAAEDLFGLDSFNALPRAAPTQAPQSTGSSNAAFHAPGSPTSKSSSSHVATFKPFVPTSTFGQSLQPQTTGSTSAAPVTGPPPGGDDDLLGDNDPEETKKLTNETAELANLSNQISSLASEMQNVQGKRTTAEQSLSEASQQKRDFEARLAQARAMYDEEVKNFKALEERLRASKAETSKLHQEYALIDGSRQDLQAQYEQVSAALKADQQENASLKEKIRAANASVTQLKPVLEKARSDARQQKGLTAINKKQLATIESEHSKMQDEIAELSRERATTESGSRFEPRAATVSSPAESTASQQTNPFFKRTPTASSDSLPSPPASNDQQRAFEDLFGPSFGPPVSATPPPPTSFRSNSPAVPQPPATKSPVASGIPTPSGTPPLNTGIVPEQPAAGRTKQIITTSIHPLGQSESTAPQASVSLADSRVDGLDTSATDTLRVDTAGLSRELDEHEYIHTSTTGPVAAQPSFHEMEELNTQLPGSSGQPERPEGAASSATDEKQVKDQDFSQGVAHEQTQFQKTNDFDEAFASMKPSSEGKVNGALRATDDEFPSIRELDDGNDDSTDEEAPMGFDDDFTPVVPAQSQSVVKEDLVESSQLAVLPAPGHMPAGQPANLPPAAEFQASPPKYEESVKKQTGEDLPPAFNGLIPSRSDPTSPPDAPYSVEASTGAPIVNGEPQHSELKDDTVTASRTGNGKSAFEAAFAGLELAPAKEEEDEDYEDTVNKKDTVDFDFSFDSASQQQPTPANSAVRSQGTAATAVDFFSFDSNMKPSFADTPAQPSEPSNGKSQEHDWDALFAPLENPNIPGGWPSSDFTQPSELPKPVTGDAHHTGWGSRPDTSGGDEILQRLTGMGFARDDSVTALEKFDYNLDKAADFLTSKS